MKRKIDVRYILEFYTIEIVKHSFYKIHIAFLHGSTLFEINFGSSMWSSCCSKKLKAFTYFSSVFLIVCVHGNTLWSDETQVHLFDNNAERNLLWSKRKKFHNRFTGRMVKHDRGNLLVWGCFSWTWVSVWYIS